MEAFRCFEYLRDCFFAEPLESIYSCMEVHSGNVIANLAYFLKTFCWEFVLQRFCNFISLFLFKLLDFKIHSTS